MYIKKLFFYAHNVFMFRMALIVDNNFPLNGTKCFLFVMEIVYIVRCIIYIYICIYIYIYVSNSSRTISNGDSAFF
jgi:hypothetical protein